MAQRVLPRLVIERPLLHEMATSKLILENPSIKCLKKFEMLQKYLVMLTLNKHCIYLPTLLKIQLCYNNWFSN